MNVFLSTRERLIFNLKNEREGVRDRFQKATYVVQVTVFGGGVVCVDEAHVCPWASGRRNHLNIQMPNEKDVYAESTWNLGCQ